MELVWDSDWFPRALGGFLARDDALRLAVSVSLPSHHGAYLRRYLVALHGPLAPMSARDLVVCAAQHGDWDALVVLQKRCKPMSQRCRKRQRMRRLEEVVCAIEQATGAMVVRSLRAAMRLQRCHPVHLPSCVLYSAAQRGRLEEIAWLVDVVRAFDPLHAIECAARGGHARAVQWFLDFITRRAEEQDEEGKDNQDRRERQRTFHCEIRLDDPLLCDVGVITWREEPRKVAYCYVAGRGLLPRHREFRWVRGYPLMDWAADRGDVALLRRLAEHPVAGTSLSATGLQVAASQGHLGVLQWRWQHNEQGMVPHLASIMAAAATRGDMAMLEWVLSCVHDDTSALGSLTGVFEAACASGHLSVVRWVFHHCLDERVRPRYVLMTAAGAGHVDVVTYLHEEQGYSVVGSTVAQAVTHGHLEAARYLYDRCSARLSDGDKAMFVPMAVKSGKLAVVKWVVNNLGLWSDQAIENAVWATGDEGVGVLRFLWARDQAQLGRNLASVSLVRLIMRGKTDVAEWIMKNVEESDTTPIASSDVVWFSAFLWPEDHRSTRHVALEQASTHRDEDHNAHFVANILGLMLCFRPRFCCQIKRLPVWAAVHGNLEVLRRLEAIGHSYLLTDGVVDAMIKNTRDPAPIIWLLQRRSLSPQQTKQVVRWAAQYCALSVLQSLLEVSHSNASTSSVLMRIAAWHGARHGHSEVLQVVQYHFERSKSDGIPYAYAKSHRGIDAQAQAD